MLPPSSFAEVAYVDDLVQIVQTETAAELLPCLQTLAACAHDAAAERGLQVNYGAGKTEAFVAPRGHGSRAVKATLMHQCQGVYKHLGTFLQNDGITARERRGRISAARSTAGQLHPAGLIIERAKRRFLEFHL